MTVEAKVKKDMNQNEVSDTTPVPIVVVETVAPGGSAVDSTVVAGQLPALFSYGTPVGWICGPDIGEERTTQATPLRTRTFVTVRP